MACYSPIKAFYGREVSKSSGKRRLVFSERLAMAGPHGPAIPVMLPCGQCVGCRLEYSRQWAMRLSNESKLHNSNWFATLTYDDKNLPYGGTLVKRDLQLFMKQVRYRYGKGVRFYGCGEYGEKLGRPHYHVILFNLCLDDLRKYSGDKPDEILYTSAALDACWHRGVCLIGSVTFNSCAYVARYVTKKIRGPEADDYYSRLLSDGTVVYLQPEFANMSRKPGIGTGYYMKYAHEIYAHDSVVVNGKEVKPPRFYDTKWAQLDPVGLSEIKKARKPSTLLDHQRQVRENRPDRRRVREKVQQAQLAQLKRTL